MAELAKKFVDRAPRYVIRASDNKFLKFAPDGDYQHIFTTRLVNISISGLAFITTVDQAPKKGDLIKMEFPIPGGEQIAWWGKVVRIENYSAKKSWQPQSEDFYDKKEILVAVKFESLPDGHMQRIRSGLLAKAQELAQ
ncbi:MAG: PilZ domain-containing protein [Bdellovibrionales bacterium]|nr:PilZ domain-containing protein [Bdellovibrionales bacterium]